MAQHSLDKADIRAIIKHMSRHVMPEQVAASHHSNELDVLITNKRDKKAAIKFFKKLFKSQRQPTRKIITDKLASYKAALRDIGSNTLD